MEYLEWLHQLTILAYDEKIIIGTEAKGDIESWYANGFTPEQALRWYKIEYL